MLVVISRNAMIIEIFLICVILNLLDVIKKKYNSDGHDVHWDDGKDASGELLNSCGVDNMKIADTDAMGTADEFLIQNTNLSVIADNLQWKICLKSTCWNCSEGKSHTSCF